MALEWRMFSPTIAEKKDPCWDAHMGLVWSFISETFPPKSTFSVEDIPDLTGKVVIVTGANVGLGKETAKALLAHDAKVYFACRSPERAEAAIKDLKEETGKEGIFLKLDLGDLHSVKAAAAEFQSKEKELHILFNNAGVMAPPIDWLTTQEYDLQFGTNVLGHFYFTKLLLPTLISTAKSTPNGKTRIITTSSGVGHFGKIDFNTFRDGPARKKLGTNRLYAQSKIGNTIVSNEFARRYEEEGIISIALSPGALKTELTRHNGIPEWALSLFLHPASQGALTQLWAGTSDDGLTLNGKYLIPWARVGKTNPLASDEAIGKELWAWLEEQVKDI